MKKILIIIPSMSFRDEDFEYPYNTFHQQKYKVDIAAPGLEKMYGVLGIEVIPDLTIEHIKVKDYDAIIIIGASKSQEIHNPKKLIKITNEAFNNKILLGAIGNTPSLFAKAGILKGVICTSAFSESINIKNLGGKYIGQGVVIDNNIITAASSTYAKEFARQIVEFLEDKFLNII